MERLLGVAPTRSIQRVEQAEGLPQVDEIRQMLDNLDNEPDSDECDGDEFGAAGHPRCSFAPNRKENSKSLQTNGFVVADLVETNVLMHDSLVYDAAVALAESLEQLGKHEQKYVAEDLYKDLTKDIEYLATTEKHVQDKSDSESESSDDKVEHHSEDMHAHPKTHAGNMKASQAASSSTTAQSDIVDPNTNHGENSPASVAPSQNPVSAELQAFRKQRAKDWVIWKSKTKPTWNCIALSRFFELWRVQLARKMPARNLFLLEAEFVFSPAMFHADTKSVSNGLRMLHENCNHRFWGVANAEQVYAGVVKDLPQEVSQPCTLDDLHREYKSLQQWMRSLKSEPYGYQFFEILDCTVQRLSEQDEAFGELLTIKKIEIIGASHWQHRWHPRPKTVVETALYGRCLFISARTSPDMMKLYSHVQSTPLCEIRARRVWHIVLCWQFTVHAAVSTESLAETVGSFLAHMNKSQANLSVRRTAWAAQLKALGIRGASGEEGFLSMALNNHFVCQSPEGWHLFPSNQSNKSSHWRNRKANVQRDLRLQNAPVWIGEHLLDLCATRQVRLCKHLPLPWEFAVSATEARDTQQSATVKRKRVEESTRRQLEPESLSARLWQHLGVTRHVLPSHARPGRRPR